MRRTKLIAAIDTPGMKEATQWVSQLGDHVDALKFGMEFTYARGFDAVRTTCGAHKLFLDLKLHDIPNTVARGLASLAPVRPAMVTVHAAGGREMIRAARDAIETSFPEEARPLLLAVTVLTSMDAAGLQAIGVQGTPEEQVLRLGELALASGADGLVCSAEEIEPLRRALGHEPTLVVPGIRPAGADHQDQKRVMTPTQAAQAGADWIVVGRPITLAPDPASAARAIIDELKAVADAA